MPFPGAFLSGDSLLFPHEFDVSLLSLTNGGQWLSVYSLSSPGQKVVASPLPCFELI